MEKKEAKPLLRDQLAKYIEKAIGKYQYYEQMPENDYGYNTIDPESYLKMADAIIPMVKQGIKPPPPTPDREKSLEECKDEVAREYQHLFNGEYYRDWKQMEYNLTNRKLPDWIELRLKEANELYASQSVSPVEERGWVSLHLWIDDRINGYKKHLSEHPEQANIYNALISELETIQVTQLPKKP